jgi:hypothetical protein
MKKDLVVSSSSAFPLSFPKKKHERQKIIGKIVFFNISLATENIHQKINAMKILNIGDRGGQTDASRLPTQIW